MRQLGLSARAYHHVLKLARRAGFISVIYGAESASPRLLKCINKGVSMEDIRQAVRTSHEIGFWTGIEIIAGLPTETDEDTRATENFLNENAECLDAVYLNTFRLLEYSEFGRYPEKYGLANLRRAGYQDKIKIAKDIPVEMAFDEANGLEWKGKIRQIAGSFATVQDAIPSRLIHYPYQELWPTVYSLYSGGYAKNFIRQLLAEHANHVWRAIRLKNFWLGEPHSFAK